MPVYAQFEGGKQGTRWSLITCKDDRLLLYSLEDERPSSEAIIIPVNINLNFVFFNLPLLGKHTSNDLFTFDIFCLG